MTSGGLGTMGYGMPSAMGVQIAHPDSLTVANRRASSLEAEAVKRSHLPGALRPVSYLWSYPVRWASALAAKRVNAAA
jgi:hypothetical protein